MLTVKNLTVTYGERLALEDVNIEVKEGEIVAVLGPNGAGKSTLLKALSGIVPPRAGTLEMNGVGLSNRRPAEIVRLGVAHVPERRRVFPELTVRENLIMGAYVLGKASSDTWDFVTDLFPHLVSRMQQLAGTLSGGEQQMLAIARGLMSNPKLLMLDEPGLGLAPKIVDVVYEGVQKIRDSGVTTLIVEQNAVLASEVSDRGYILSNGKVVFSGEGRSLSDGDLLNHYWGIQE